MDPAPSTPPTAAEPPSAEGDDASSSRLASTAAVASTVAKSTAKTLSNATWAAGSYISAYVNQRQSGQEAGQPESRVPSVAAADGVARLGSAEVLNIANTLDGIFMSGELAGCPNKLKEPEVPRLVVVGTQSSGKSSLLNGIMGADILPLGEQMVTRAPLSLQLVHVAEPSEMRAEFGAFVEGVWVPEEPIALACPDPTPAQLECIRRNIEAQTEARAGGQKGVSTNAIFLRLFSPNVPNLSLVDLPGLTMTALTAQGQPKDIKAQIRNMVSSYISQQRTIILMVCPARADLEADPAVELAREHDPLGQRTVGILTKVDLMNQGTDVTRYLTNSVPADLQLHYGYFAVKMRGPSEAGLTVLQGFGAESTYFAGHPIYGRASAACKERIGVPAMTRFLSKVLLQQLKRHMPEILKEVNILHAATERKLRDHGLAVPNDESDRTVLIQDMVASFCREFTGALVEKRADVKTGRHIKDAFNALTSQLRDVKPFDSRDDFSDSYLIEAVRDCEGLHLSFPVPPIEIIEHMLTHPEKAPISKLREPCHHCLSTVHEELRALAAQIVTKGRLARFPKLQAKLREEVDRLLDSKHALAFNKLEEVISMEEAYIYTDDASFLKELATVVTKLATRLDPQLLRSILSSYYDTIVRSVSNAAPKAIMLHLVKATEQSINTALFESVRGSPHDGLLEEPPEVETKRQADQALLAKLRAAKRALEAIA